jgi:hypothetical protein
MRKKTFFTALIILVAFAMRPSIGFAAPKGIPTPIVPNGLGVNIHLTHFSPEELQKLKDGGFGFIRMDMFWQDIEQKKGVYDFSSYDVLSSDLDKIGARPVYILDYANPLYDNSQSPYTQEGRDAFAKFAAAAARHFAKRGVIWEIWNEPNIGFWHPSPNAENYGLLARDTIKTMRKADRSAVILAGATSGIDLSFIETLLKNNDLAGASAISVHPYRGNEPETAADEYVKLRELIKRYSKKPIPIICSEWGYSTNAKGLTEAQQASYTLREYLTNLVSDVNLTIIYDWKNDGTYVNDPEQCFGSLHNDLTPKASYLAISSFVRQLRGYRFLYRKETIDPHQYVLVFTTKKDIAIVSWNTTDASGYPIPSIKKL